MLYKVNIKYTTRAIAVVEADSKEDADRMFESGDWDDLFGEEMCDWEVTGTVKGDK